MSAPVGLAVTLDDLVFDPSDTRHYLSASNNGAHERKYYFPRLEDDDAVPAKVVVYVHKFLDFHLPDEWPVKAEFYNLFCRFLGNQPRRRFDDARAGLNLAIQNHHPIRVFRAFVQRYFLETARVNHYAALQQIRRPRETLVDAFAARLEMLNALGTYLAGDTPQLNDAQLAHAFLQAMPSRWITNYDNVHAGNVGTMAQLLNYFRYQETMANQSMNEHNRGGRD